MFIQLHLHTTLIFTKVVSSFFGHPINNLTVIDLEVSLPKPSKIRGQTKNTKSKKNVESPLISDSGLLVSCSILDNLLLNQHIFFNRTIKSDTLSCKINFWNKLKYKPSTP